MVRASPGLGKELSQWTYVPVEVVRYCCGVLPNEKPRERWGDGRLHLRWRGSER